MKPAAPVTATVAPFGIGGMVAEGAGFGQARLCCVDADDLFRDSAHERSIPYDLGV